MMSDEDILAEFRAAGALLEGHLILSSGLRSPRYLQGARVLMDGARAERMAQALAGKIPSDLRARIETVVSPAMGGAIIGHALGAGATPSCPRQWEALSLATRWAGRWVSPRCS